MKKLAIITATVLAVFAVMSSCDKDSEKTESKPDNEMVKAENDSADTSEDSDVRIPDFLGFGDVGNNPNNFVLTDKPLAFDDNYIYYTKNSSLCRIDYNGKNHTELGDIKGADYLNIKDGYAYYSAASDRLLNIYRFNLNTCVEENIYSEKGLRVHDLNAMLVVDNYLFYIVDESVSDKDVSVHAIDLNTLQNYNIYTTSTYYTEYSKLTADAEHNVYAFIATDEEDYSNEMEYEIFKVNTADIASGAEMSYFAEKVMSTMFSFAGDCVILGYSEFPDTCGFKPYYYNEVVPDEYWVSGGAYITGENMTEDKQTLIKAYNYATVLGNNMMVFVTDSSRTDKEFVNQDGKTNIFLSDGTDLNGIRKVGTLGLRSRMTLDRMGVKGDKFYYLELDDENRNAVNLIEYNTEGTGTKHTIQ